MTKTDQTHIVLKISDCQTYLTTEELQTFAAIVNKVADGRKSKGKKVGQYLIVNSDEPYYEELYHKVLVEEAKKTNLETC